MNKTDISPCLYGAFIIMEKTENRSMFYNMLISNLHYVKYVNLIDVRIHSRVDSGFIESECYIT